MDQLTNQHEAHVGIQVGGGSLVESIIDAQITGFVKGILQFFATGSTTSGTRWDYDYGVFLYYNLGYNAKATIFGWADWALGARTAYKPDRRVTIFRDEGTIDLAAGNDGIASISGGNVSVEDLGDSVFRRQNDDIGMSDPEQPALTAPRGVCPDGGGSTHTIPELRCKDSLISCRCLIDAANTYCSQSTAVHFQGLSSGISRRRTLCTRLMACARPMPALLARAEY